MTESEAFQKMVDWFVTRGQSKIYATQHANNYSASRTHEIEDSELRVLTAMPAINKTYSPARRCSC